MKSIKFSILKKYIIIIIIIIIIIFFYLTVSVAWVPAKPLATDAPLVFTF